MLFVEQRQLSRKQPPGAMPTVPRAGSAQWTDEKKTAHLEQTALKAQEAIVMTALLSTAGLVTVILIAVIEPSRIRVKRSGPGPLRIGDRYHSFDSLAVRLLHRTRGLEISSTTGGCNYRQQRDGSERTRCE